ncbi:hypothetical protein [Nocardioides marmoraquaticus]
MHHRTRRAAAGLAVAATTVLVAAPLAGAATVVSRADASAAIVGVAGQGGQGTGPVEATFDGENESVSGNTTPASIPGGGFVNVGVLTQQATAGNGFSAACAGVAGSGGGVIQIGDGSCLRPGNSIAGSLGDLRVGDITGGIDQLPAELKAVLDQLTTPIDGAIGTVTGGIEQAAGELGLTLRLDAVEGRCTVQDGSPSGSASIANARLVASGGRQDLVLAELPANPGPDTEVLTNLSSVVDVLLEGVESDLNDSLTGALDPAGELLIQPIRQQLVAAIRDNIEDQLAPLEDNLLRITLNEQSNPTADSIRVTALHAEVLPAAEQFVDAALLDVKIGDVGCGPAGVVSAEEPPAPAPEQPDAGPRIPTAVSAGEAGDDDGVGVAGYAALAVGAAAAGAAGWGSLRRRSALRG